MSCAVSRCRSELATESVGILSAFSGGTVLKRAGIGGTIALLIAVLSWGGLFPAGKLVLAALDPYWLSSIRYAISALLFLLILTALEGPAALRFEGRAVELAIFGLFGFTGFSLLVFEGLRYTTPQQAAIIAATQPMVITLYQRFAQGVRLSRVTLVCTIVALLGCATVVTRGDFAALVRGGDVLGNLLVFSGAMCWVVYTLGGARFREWSPVRYTALSCALGTFGILVGTAAATWIGHARVPSLEQVHSVAMPLAFLIVMASVVAVLLWNIGVHKVGPLHASLFGNFVPVIAFIIGAIQGYPVTPPELFGATLVVGSLIANNLFVLRSSR